MKRCNGVVCKWGWFLIACVLSLAGALAAQAQDSDAITAKQLAGSKLKFTHVGPPTSKNGMAHSRFGIPNIDSVPSFDGQYFTPGVDSNGNPQKHWYYNTLGNPPQMGGTTTLNAPIVPVSLDLRNADGSPRYVKVVNGVITTCANPPSPGCQRLFFDVTPFIQPVLDSPVFSDTNYTSSPVPTQFTDAVQRAEYNHKAKADWHTLLVPSVKTTRTMTLIRGTYQYALNADGSCCFFVLIDAGKFVNELFPSTSTFPPDSSTPIGAAEASGDITTKDVSTFFFPPAYLFEGSLCCIGGFHEFDVESGDASNGNVPRLFIMNYSTWDAPIFGGEDPPLDVTGLSHELSETFNDPFVVFDGTHNLTPWWLSPNGNCQNDLEVGDVIEGLPGETFPIAMPNGYTYHPQVEALLQWFEFEYPSSALNGAYSYPDIYTLTGLSAPQKAGCQP